MSITIKTTTGVKLYVVEAETLANANLSGARLTNADLAGADLRGAGLKARELGIVGD